MSNNFWATRLAAVAPAPNPAPQQAPQAWWMSPTGPVQSQPANVVEPAPVYSTTRAQSAKLNDTCPACFSGNYFVIGSKFSQSTNRMESVARCYDCGYPVVQQFTGAGGPSGMGGGEVSGAARQLPSNHVVSQLENGRGSIASGDHTRISSAAEAIGHV